jgi:hypothetical protein
MALGNVTIRHKDGSTEYIECEKAMEVEDGVAITYASRTDVKGRSGEPESELIKGATIVRG